MTATVTASQRGRSNRRKGHDAERDLAKYLRNNGWPLAERKSDNGWRASDRASDDHGDIRGCDRLVWQVKNVTAMSDTEISRAWRDAQTQAVAAGADLGILVERRAGKADPGMWWSWISAFDVHGLIVGEAGVNRPHPVFDVPVRLLVSHLVPLLHVAGYGVAA